MKKKINTFPFSELLSNDLETLPLGAQAIEQSSISSSSSDSSISAAPGRVGKPPPQPITNVTVYTEIPLITLSVDGRLGIIFWAKQNRH